MKVRLMFLLSYIGLCCNLCAQSVIRDNFEIYAKSGFQEKIYVHTDKNSYTAGEIVWFKAYRVDATYHSPKLYSGVVYVDMFDSKDSLIKRMKIVPTDSCFMGSYKIPASVPSGTYCLVAYTNWQQNFDEAFYFRKKLYFHNPTENRLNVSIDYSLDEPNGVVHATANFTDVEDKPFSGVLVDVKLTSGKSEKSRLIKEIDRQGGVKIDLNIKDSISSIEMMFTDSEPFSYNRIFGVPVFGRKLDVQFMPEGGHLLANVEQQIAVKALDPDGKGAFVTGTVFNSANDVVTMFAASHKGMGSFMLKALPGETYYADIVSAEGAVNRYNLPEVAVEGIALQVINRAGVLRCNVLKTPEFSSDSLFLALQCRSRLLLTLPLDNNASLQYPVSRLPEGVIHCFIVDAKGTVYSERLTFVNNDVSTTVDITGGKPIYAKREKVTLKLAVGDADNRPLVSDMSVSVVDTRRTIRDSLQNNIVSYLMMSSDIKGEIEDPRYYFDKRIDLSVRNRNVDLLMLNQAWKRFDVAAICRKDSIELPFALELGQSISGQIKSLWGGKDVAHGTLSLVSTAEKLFRIVSTDEQGNFAVDNIRFPENTTFVLQGFSEQNRKSVEVVIDPEIFKPLKTTLFPRVAYTPKRLEQQGSVDKYKSMGLNYYYENGVRVYAMDEIVVTTSANKLDATEEYYKDMSDNHITSDQLLEGGYNTIQDWLSGVPGVIIDEVAGSVSIRGGRTPTILADDIIVGYQDLFAIPISEIKSIGVVKNAANLALLTEESSEGAIIVRLKDGFSLNNIRKETNSFFQIKPLGHHLPDKFYNPKYETPKEKANAEIDERVTLYWNPIVRTDATGVAWVSFYTADIPTIYNLTIEGVNTLGQPIYKQYSIEHR